jgi:cellobiose phosphorylase
MSISPSIGQKGLLAALKHQNKDGSAIRCWDPTLPAKPSDCHMWITLTLTEYIKETGDYSILEHTIPYFDSGKATILEHWLGSLEFMYDNRGSHGLCLIFDCDWNDSMTVGKKGLGESVLTTQSAIYAMKESLPLFEKLKLYEKIKCFEERIEELTEICNDVAWDGKWYIRAFNDEGEIIGSSKNLELGEIYLNTQTWAVLSGIADAKKFELMDDQVEKKLLCKYGYKICHPGYKEPVPSLARIGSMNFGIYENNSVYCHANTFKIISEYLLGRYDKAWQIAKLMFTNRNFNPSANESGAEPYAFTNQFMSPDSPTPGKSCIGWITGTASWMNQILLKYIPGVLPDYDGLKIIPSIPSEINCLKLKRYFRGAFYNFDIALDNSIGTDEIYIELNNKELSSNVIPVQHAKSVNKVVVRYSR